jgi:predicted dehydrogenase
MNKNDIVIRIRTGLRHKRMSQRDLAAALGKNEAEVSRWLSGRMGISEMNLQKIEDILEVPLTAESIARQQSNYLRIGVIGTGSIAKRFAQEMAYVDKVYLAAAYNPDEDELKKYCDEFGIANESNSLEEMFRVVDAIYIASPYYTHYEYALAALEADRHVLCETPLTLSHKDAQELYSIAEKKGLVLMPALKTAYSQSFVNVIGEALSGAIGEVVAVSATVTTLLPKSVTVGFNNERLQDNTYYALLAIFKLLGTEYKKVYKFTRTDDAKDLYIDATLEYEDAVAHVRAGTGVKSESSLVISGSKGYIYVPAPWWKPDYFEIRYENPYNNKKLYFPFESSGLRYEIKAFLDCIGMKDIKPAITKKELLKIIQLVNKYLR